MIKATSIEFSVHTTEIKVERREYDIFDVVELKTRDSMDNAARVQLFLPKGFHFEIPRPSEESAIPLDTETATQPTPTEGSGADSIPPADSTETTDQPEELSHDN